MSKARILMFGWEFPPHHSGGLGVACFGLTRALAAQGHELVFVMPKKLAVGAPWARFVFADAPSVEGIAVSSIATPYGTHKTVVRGRNGEVVYGWGLMEEVLRYAATGADIAREAHCDIIYAHDWLSFGAGHQDVGSRAVRIISTRLRASTRPRSTQTVPLVSIMLNRTPPGRPLGSCAIE
jgi:hypothetical protein